MASDSKRARRSSQERLRVGFACCLVFFPLLVSASPRCAKPVDVVKALYGSSYDFYYKGGHEEFFTSTFQSGISAEVDCLKREGECSLDYDPWLGAQDGEISPPLRYAVVSDMEGYVVVQFTYRFTIANTARPHAVEIVLHKQPDGCWKVNDFITPIGVSLLGTFGRS